MDVGAALLWAALHVADLQRPRIAQSVTVMAAPSPIYTPSAVTTLRARELAAAPALGLDDVLRSVPGFSLFRRSSSRVANPTTQGATLRGLAASGASRALVLADGVPLNDPFGGWVYWNRIPIVAIDEVSVSRGAAGDLHGADALAGVVSIRTRQMPGANLLAEGGSHASGRLSTFGRLDRGASALSGGVETSTTGGFVTVAPESRGPVDTAASSRYVSTHAAVAFRTPPADITLRGAHFRESRENGTPLQRNSTRISTFASSMEGLAGRNGSWRADAHASTQQYEQTFSAVFAGRAAERITSRQLAGATAYEGEAEYWWSNVQRAPELSAKLHVKRVAADLLATAYTAAGDALPDDDTAASQMSIGGAVRSAYRWSRAAAGATVRVERWSSGGSHDVVLSPRLWVTAAPAPTVSVTAAYQSGFRAPTLNELYRPFRVGSVLTQANTALTPERARGLEAGLVWHFRGGTARALAFWSRVDDAIANVTLSAGEELILRQRQNAARIRAAGTELEVEARIGRLLTLTGASSYTDSVFVRGPLEGLAVPQVPEWQHSAGARLIAGRLKASAEWRFIGMQFDDDRNAFELGRSSMVDARVGWSIGRRVELFGAIENVLDEEQDVGRTPLRTIGLPRISRVGLRVRF